MKNQKIKAKIFQPIYGQLLVNETFIVNSKALQIDVKILVKNNWKSQKTKKLRIDCKNSRQPFCKWKRKKKNESTSSGYLYFTISWWMHWKQLCGIHSHSFLITYNFSKSENLGHEQNMGVRRYMFFAMFFKVRVLRTYSKSNTRFSDSYPVRKIHSYYQDTQKYREHFHSHPYDVSDCSQ